MFMSSDTYVVKGVSMGRQKTVRELAEGDVIRFTISDFGKRAPYSRSLYSTGITLEKLEDGEWVTWSNPIPQGNLNGVLSKLVLEKA